MWNVDENNRRRWWLENLHAFSIWPVLSPRIVAGIGVRESDGGEPADSCIHIRVLS